MKNTENIKITESPSFGGVGEAGWEAETRKLGLGSSDAKMVAKIAGTCTISEADKRRLAVMLSMEEQKQFSTKATEYGNQIEAQLYMIIVQKYPQAVSNPFYQSAELSEKYGFGVFNHIDFEVETERELIWIECKATQRKYVETLKDYEEQLSWHNMLLEEKAEKIGKNPVLMLAHYHVTDYGMFDAQNLVIGRTATANMYFHKGLKIISETIKSGLDYKKQEDVYAENLPVSLQNKLQEVASDMNFIKQAEERINNIKNSLLTFMEREEIKKIQTEFLNITRIAPSVSAVFDKKEFEKQHPDLAQKFTKNKHRKAYIKASLNPSEGGTFKLENKYDTKSRNQNKN